MARIFYSDEALRDFDRIIEFLITVTPEHADEVVESIREAIDILATHPFIGRRRDARRRELVISHGKAGYIAMYRYDAEHDVIRILRLRHQREAGFFDL